VFYTEKMKISGISQLPCTVNNSNDSVDIRVLKIYRCAKIIATDQILHF
jgi:hypothetical protein